MRTRVAFALSEIFVVNVASITASWPLFGAAGFMDLLAEHALGNYRSLLAAVSRNLSMGCMLTYRGSRKEDPRTGRHPDENYAREVMQLFSIGLLQLHPDGTPAWKAARRWKPIRTPTSRAWRVFTGWDLDGPETDVEFHRRPMKLDPALHSMAEKRFLGTVIPAGTGGPQSLALAMDAISAHPNVGPFIGAQLIQRLVASNPSPAYVARVAAVFADDGLGARGNLKAVTRAVLLDPEARFPDLASPHWGKVREPILRFSGWARPSARARATAPGPCPTPATTPSGWRKARCARPACSTSSGRATRPPPPSWRARAWPRRNCRSPTKPASPAT